MRTVRLSLLGAVILALLGGVSGVVVGQDEEAPPAEFPTGPAAFTIIEDDGLNIVATDPRMSGIANEGRGFSLSVPTGHFVASVPLRIVNQAGTGKWQCTSSEYGTVGTESYWPWYYQSWCVGEGDYEGLSAIMFASMETGPDGAIVETDRHGLIFEGDPPVIVTRR